MDPRHLFIDECFTDMCAYCGAQPNTRDHVPSKVLLDEPYPLQLPVVRACDRCNESISLDEQYLACFLDCVISGGTKIDCLNRPNVKRILSRNPALQKRLENAKRKNELDNLQWEPEFDRIRNVILKLARGHIAYELYPKFEEPTKVSFVPLQMLSEEKRSDFEDITSGKHDLWPEIGSRAFSRVLGKSPDCFEKSGDWIIIQPSRYRYAVTEKIGVLVRMVLSEYLACKVFWEI